MKRCEKCGSDIGQGQVTCQQCGNPIVQDEGKKCPFCETYCGPFAKICSSCGHPLFAQQQKKTVMETKLSRNNVIQFDAKKIKKKKARQIKKQQRRPKKFGQMILGGSLVILFVLGVISMFI